MKSVGQMVLIWGVLGSKLISGLLSSDITYHIFLYMEIQLLKLYRYRESIHAIGNTVVVVLF